MFFGAWKLVFLGVFEGKWYIRIFPWWTPKFASKSLIIFAQRDVVRHIREMLVIDSCKDWKTGKFNERRKQRSEKRGPGWSKRQENARILPATPKCAHAWIINIVNLIRFEKDQRSAFARQNKTKTKQRNRKKKKYIKSQINIKRWKRPRQGANRN